MTFNKFQKVVCKNKLDYKVPPCKISAIMMELGKLAEIGNDDAVIGVLRNREMEVRIIGRLLWRIFEYAVKQGIYMEGVIKVLLKSYEK